jgi:hypothetical protein
MDEVTRYHEINKNIASIESFFDVLQVISNNGLLGEVKGASIGYLFSEMAEKLETVKKLHEETYEKVRGERVLSGYVSPF